MLRFLLASTVVQDGQVLRANAMSALRVWCIYSLVPGLGKSSRVAQNV